MAKQWKKNVAYSDKEMRVPKHAVDTESISDWLQSLQSLALARHASGWYEQYLAASTANK